MNVMRFNGKDNRSALDQVRAALGPEALILSNRRTSAGVEICATAELPDLSQARRGADTGCHTAACRRGACNGGQRSVLGPAQARAGQLARDAAAGAG